MNIFAPVQKFFDNRVYLYVGLFGLLLVIDVVAIYYSLYFTYRWLDIPVHLVAGFLVAGFFYYVFFSNNKTSSILNIEYNLERVFDVTVFWVFLVTIIFEIVEFLVGRSSISPAYFPDTFLDITVGTLGGLIFYWIHRTLQKKKARGQEETLQKG